MHFIFVTQGPATLRFLETNYLLHQRMYAAVPGSFSIENKAGVVISRNAHHGFFYLGDPVEETGRLRYIDGCTDSLVIPPIRMVDPCLNNPITLFVIPWTNPLPRTPIPFFVAAIS